VSRIEKVLGNELVGHGSKQIEMSELGKKSRAKKFLLSRDMCLCEATVKDECLLRNPLDKNDSTKTTRRENSSKSERLIQPFLKSTFRTLTVYVMQTSVKKTNVVQLPRHPTKVHSPLH